MTKNSFSVEILKSMKLGVSRLDQATALRVVNQLLEVEADFTHKALRKLKKEERTRVLIKAANLEECIEIAFGHAVKLKNKLLKPLENLRYQKSGLDDARDKLNGLNVEAELMANELTPLFNKRFEYIKTSATYSLQKRLGDIVLFASSFGGLSFHEALKAMLNALLSEDKPLHCVGGRFFMDLTYVKSNHPTCVIVDDQKQSLRRFYPDDLTLGAILGFLKCYKKGEHYNILKPKGVKALLQPILKEIGVVRLSRTSVLCEALLIAGLRHTKVCLPFVFRQFAAGRVSSAPLSLTSLLAHFNSKPRHVELNQYDNTAESRDLKARLNSLDSADIAFNNDNIIIDRMKVICEQESNGNQQWTRQQTLQHLKALRTRHDLNLQTEIFLEWIMDGLNDGKRWEFGKNTAVRYINAIGQAWVEIFKDIDIRDVGPDEMDICHEAILNIAGTNDSIAPNALDLLFQFISKRFPIAIPEFLEDSGSRNHVRNQIVPESVFQQLRHEMQLLYSMETVRFKQALDALLIVIRRCFLRPAEAYKLQLNEIETSDDLILHIHKNRLGSIKTLSSDRIIEVSMLLRDDEREILDQYISQRRLETKNTANVPIFVRSVAGNKLFNEKLVNKACTEILSQLTGERTVFYQHRHSGISELSLIVFASSDTVAQYTDMPTEQIAAIKHKLCKNKEHRYFQIASLAGHINPKTTLTYYSHFTDLILHDHLRKYVYKGSVKFWSNLSNLRPTSIIKGKAVLQKNMTICSSTVLPQLAPKLQVYCQKYDKMTSTKKRANITASKFRPDITRCNMILKSYDLGANNQDIAQTYSIPLAYVEAVIEAAVEVKHDSRLQTSKGKYRLFSPNSERIAPSQIYEDAAETDMHRMLSNILAIARTRPKRIKDALINVLCSCDNSHSYMKFTSRKKLISHLNFFNNVVEPSRWRCIVHPSDDTKRDEKWNIPETLLPKINIEMDDNNYVKNIRLFPEGRAFLHLLDINADEKIKLASTNRSLKANGQKKKVSKYSSNSFKVAVHWALIMLLAKDKYDAFKTKPASKQPNSNQRQIAFDF